MDQERDRFAGRLENKKWIRFYFISFIRFVCYQVFWKEVVCVFQVLIFLIFLLIVVAKKTTNFQNEKTDVYENAFWSLLIFLA